MDEDDGAGVAAAFLCGAASAADMTLKLAGMHPIEHYGNTML